MVTNKQQLSRRRFLKSTGLGLVAPSFITARALGSAAERPASERWRR